MMNLKYDFLNDKANFVASAPTSLNLLSLARRVAKHNVPILITGETGTGKECIAKYIHHHAFGDNAPYVGLNCAAIPETMLEAMLFGYEKGAFTGATTSVAGKFEQANGGTLLLDEIGDMPLSLQAKLLRVLQEQEVERLGSNKKIALNIRLIASTNKDLEKEIEVGNFRQDLFYRLSVVPMHIAPLRERQQDIFPLVQRFIHKYGTFSAERIQLSPEAQQILYHYSWPGNVRELENIIQRGIIMSEGAVISAQDLGLNLSHCASNDLNFNLPALASCNNESHLTEQVRGEASVLANNIQPAMDKEHNRELKQRGRLAEYQYIFDLLERYQGNKSKTAQFLGITPRALRYRLASMREQGINVECFS